MFDATPYKNLVPCLFENKIKESMEVLKRDLPDFLRFFPNLSYETLLSDYDKVRSWIDFHKIVLFNDLVPELLRTSSDELSVEGVENIGSDKPCLFVSNHRDTILDCIMLGYALLSNGKSVVQPVLGSNLTDISEVEPYLTVCGGIVINRNLEMRELYTQSVLLSRYMTDSISSGYSSVWIAGSAGRSKDGIDSVKPSVMKMIMLSKQKGETINDFLSRIRIVPVSISYEFDPSDILKAYATANESGKYVKSKKEDYFSILKSLKENKGRISISFSKPVKPEFDDADSLAESICKSIIAGYKLYPINYYAYDKINGTQEHASEYDAKKCDVFFDKAKHLSVKVRNCLLRYYGNPVFSKQTS